MLIIRNAIAIQATIPPTMRVSSCGAANTLINTTQITMSIAATAIAAAPLRAPALVLARLEEFILSARAYLDAVHADHEATPCEEREERAERPARYVLIRSNYPR
jgi:hypothetical protein